MPLRPDQRPPVPNRIFAADQRSSFYEKYLGLEKGAKPKRSEVRLGQRLKSNIIGEGFNIAVNSGRLGEDVVPGILIDEELGNDVIRRNIAAGRSVGIPVEVSGNVFNFELQYGDNFPAHIQRYERDGSRPAFVKALINYNPEMPADLKEDMFAKMERVARFSAEHGYPVMAEVLIKATDDQKRQEGFTEERFDLEERPKLAVQMIRDFNSRQIPIDVWKIEGMDKVEDYNAVLSAAAESARGAEVIVLGRNASDEQLKTWLTAAAQAEAETPEGTKRVSGFAIGRSIWGELIKDVLKDTGRDAAHRRIRRDIRHDPFAWATENIRYWTPDEIIRRRSAERRAAEQAAERYIMFSDMFTNARQEHLREQSQTDQTEILPAN